jgi:hypothetical protein
MDASAPELEYVRQGLGYGYRVKRAGSQAAARPSGRRVTQRQVDLLHTMIAERREVFTPQETGHVDELEALLEAQDIDFRTPGDGTPMPYERWDRAFKWLKTINVRVRSERAPGGNGVPPLVAELGIPGCYGVYENPDTGEIFVVQASKNDAAFTVARRLENFSGDRVTVEGVHTSIRSVEAKGAVYRIQSAWRMDPERAKLFIQKFGRCPRCVGMGLSGRMRDGVSVEMMAGKVCAHAMGFGAAYDARAKEVYRAKRIAAGLPVRGQR